LLKQEVTVMRRFRTDGWGYKLDYDKEIAADEKLIAQMKRIIENGWFHPISIVIDGSVRDISTYSCNLMNLVFMDVARVAPQLGLSLADLGDLAYAVDQDPSCAQLDGSVVELPDPVQPGAYKRGKVIADRLSELWEGDLYPAALAQKVLKKAKTDLSRHKRNKLKYG
jgi:hypothetical protein